MNRNINIEAEGGELILRNESGDYAIIPKKHRVEVQGMIKDKCYGCIDNFVKSLPIMEDYAEDGSLYPDKYKTKNNKNEDDAYIKFKNSLPPNLGKSSESDYDMRYLWENSNKPKDFHEMQQWDRNLSVEEHKKRDIELLEKGEYDYSKSPISLVKDKEDDGSFSYNYHGGTIEPKTMRFVKPPHHKSIHFELDWYNSDNPEAVEFRSKYDLDTSGDFYRYVPRKIENVKFTYTTNEPDKTRVNINTNIKKK